MSERPVLPKPRPVPTPITQPFWDALREERVELQRCGACDTWVYYPRAHQPTTYQFADEMPQLIAIVELDEGPRLTTTLVGVEHTELTIGTKVVPVFDHGDDGLTLLRFRPA